MKPIFVPKPYIEGECFLCGEPCKPNYYVHEHCAIAKEAENRKRIKEAIKEREKKYD